MHDEILGSVEAGFERVADCFAANFSERGDTGAAFSVYLAGRPVVDLWGGHTGRGPWCSDTRSVLFSVSKGVTTVAVLMAAERGLLHLDMPVATYWPEFAANGKGATTVRQLLAHQAGLVSPDADLTVEDLRRWVPIVDVLARQRPLWRPGTAHGYHALTFGWLAGEVLRRASGLRPAQWLANFAFEPLHLDLTFGAEVSDPTLARVAEPMAIIDPEAAEQITEWLSHPVVQSSLSLGGAIDGSNIFNTANTPAFLGYEIPAGNLVGSARSLARFYAATVGEIDGIRLLKPETVRDARTVQSAGTPKLGPPGLRWGTGFMIDSGLRRMLGPGSFGHDGAGGQVACAHLESQVAMAYQTNRPGGIPDDRAEMLCATVRACM